MARELMPDAPQDHAPKRVGQKTYWHLLGQRRVPTDYEVVTTQLHYYPALGFALDTPVSEWIRRHQKIALGSDDGVLFADPRQTTYADYVQLKHEQEIHLDRSCATNTGRPLAPGALELWESVLAPARFPCHGLQMCAAYAGSMAPWSRLTVVLAFQAADEVQRIHRIAYRMAQLRQSHASLGADSRTRWEQAALWQGVREILEHMLVAYDWIDGYVALNAVFKPLWERLIFGHCAELARESGEPALAAILECYAEDGRWQAACTAAALSALRVADSTAIAAIDASIAAWTPRATRAFRELAAGLDALGSTRSSAVAILDEHPKANAATGPLT